MTSWLDYIANRSAQTVAYFNANINPDATEQTQQWLDERRAILEKLADEGGSVVRASASDNAVFQQAQAVVDDLVSSGRKRINSYYGQQRLPEKIALYVHQQPTDAFKKYGANYYQALSDGMDAAYNPDIVETHHARFPDSLHNGSWKFASAHEIGHIINQDVDAARQVERLKHPLDHRMEIEADLMATILHGDIKGQRNWRANLGHFESTIDQPNHALRAKYLDRWNALLESEGAAKDGKIIDTNKALDIFPEAFKLLKRGIHQGHAQTNVR